MTTLRSAVLMLGCIMLLAGAVSAGMPERVVLDNGLTVILAPIPGSGQVAIESFYRTGLTDEPEGMPQASHLVEHLVCNGATANYKADQAMGLLTGEGRSANAETMSCFTYYDYYVRSSDLELAVKIEAERLGSLKITQDVIGRELPKCYAEAANVERNPEAGMFKFALTALSQAWRYKATSATVKSGLQNAPLAKIQEYHRSRYQPSGAVFVIAGDFDRGKALGIARKHLGGIPSRKIVPAKPIQWESLPSRTEVRWDSAIQAVCIAFRPAGSTTDRYLLHTWGGLLSEKLASDEKISKLADCAICSDPVWTLNSQPFYIYAVPKQGVSVDDLQKALESRLREILSRPEAKDDITRAIASARQIGMVPVPPRDMVVSAAKQMFPLMKAEQAEGLVMGQVAMEFGFEELITGGKVDYLSIPEGTTPEAVLTRMKAMLDPSKEFVTVLLPMQEDRQSE